MIKRHKPFKKSPDINTSLTSTDSVLKFNPNVCIEPIVLHTLQLIVSNLEFIFQIVSAFLSRTFPDGDQVSHKPKIKIFKQKKLQQKRLQTIFKSPLTLLKSFQILKSND